jgi:putative ABC transport system permease protein
MIAALGLIGLSVFHNNSRTKEVGIRKAMGAQTATITSLLLSDFIRLVIIANVIALPAAWLILNKILQIFAYRIELKAEVFILVFLGSVAASLLTVLYHALRTSRSNPVNSLRYE